MIKQIAIGLILIVGAGIFGQYSFLKEKYTEYFPAKEIVQIAPTEKPCPYKGMEGKYFTYKTTNDRTAKGRFIKIECGGNTLAEAPIGNLYTRDSSNPFVDFILLDGVDMGTELSTAREELSKLRTTAEALQKEQQRTEELEKRLKDLTSKGK